MTIEKIVVAVDFSPESDVAVHQALAIARQQGAKLILLHAGQVPERPPGTPESMQAVLTEYLQVIGAHLDADRKRLVDLRERISGQGAEISHMVCDGPPALGIPKAAAELGADLIVTGSHGRTGLRRFLLGSVAERVVRHTACNVLVSRESEPGPTNGLRRVLVPIDFSDISKRALDTAVSLARADTVIDILHCWHMAPFSYPHDAPTPSGANRAISVRESLLGGAGKLGAALVARYGDSPCQLDFHLVEEAPATGIQDWIKTHSYDLVVTGSHGWRPPTRWLLGSVAERTVRHAPCSVLVVHDAPEGKG